ncbi:ribosomal protein S10 [Chelydra serpentina]|uniref:Ribosomal protein S10 n=1 Tax=Chelydra serpentina TaxID=8475 RepID=A0A8T1SQQ2_CHESE|nr:ribosomal protein S10 [Chelydra serpentina]
MQYLRDYLHLPPEIVTATCAVAALKLADRSPKVWKVNALLVLLRERLTDTYRCSTAPLGADKKAEAGAGAATEFQFRGGFGRGHGQPPQ